MNTCAILGVMNTDNLARTTFVLERETSAQLDFISRRMGVSRSSRVRDVLREPVALMAGWVKSIPTDRPVTAGDASDLRDTIQLDLVEFINRASAEANE